jgi:hypothetical protein
MNVVFIPNVNLNNGRSDSYKYSIDSWKHWCDKNNCLLIEWKDPILDPNKFKITLQRWWVFDILEYNNIKYDQVLMVDADTIIHPNCPNFFDETNNNFSAVINNGCYEWVTRSISEWNVLFDKTYTIPNTWEYINGGFIIGNENVKYIYDIIKNHFYNNISTINELLVKINAATDQTIINYILKKENIKINFMPDCYNLHDLFRKNLLHIPNYSHFKDELLFLNSGWIYHFNAIPKSNRNLDYWMKRTYEYLYT